MKLGICLLFFLPTFSFGDDLDEIRNCLNHWQEHPFKSGTPKFRTLTTRVKVMGIGDETVDSVKTDQPDLVLIKPNVTVMSKSTLRLLNPNGWYCMKGKVAVLGKKRN